jgi:hypothetical protein
MANGLPRYPSLVWLKNIGSLGAANFIVRAVSAIRGTVSGNVSTTRETSKVLLRAQASVPGTNAALKPSISLAIKSAVESSAISAG